ncbi:MAG: hypothetical protein K2H64_02840, partial [Desulfovibrio sp.]|nr:hypothetical protein [Desulfovibrio sp.]
MLGATCLNPSARRGHDNIMKNFFLFSKCRNPSARRGHDNLTRLCLAFIITGVTPPHAAVSWTG